MNRTIRLIMTFLCFSVFTISSIAQSKDFKTFLNNFKKLEFPFTVNDSPVKNNKTLFTKEFNRVEFLKYLNSIKEYTNKNTYFYYGSQAQFHGKNILIYRITNFGEAPALDTIKIVLVVFNTKGKMLSKMMIGGQVTEDKQINCILNADFTLTVSTLDASNKLKNKKEYFIDSNGEIKKQL